MSQVLYADILCRFQPRLGEMRKAFAEAGRTLQTNL